MNKAKLQLYLIVFLIIIGSSIPPKSIPNQVLLFSDKLLHFIEYSILGFMGYRAYDSGIKNIHIMICIYGLLFSIFDETWQLCISGRNFSYYDIIADLIGLIFGSSTYKNFKNK